MEATGRVKLWTFLILQQVELEHFLPSLIDLFRFLQCADS